MRSLSVVTATPPSSRGFASSSSSASSTAVSAAARANPRGAAYFASATSVNVDEAASTTKFSTSSMNAAAAAAAATTRTAAAAAAASTTTTTKTTTATTVGALPNDESPLSRLSDDQVIAMVQSGELSVYSLEAALGDCTRAVALRRAIIVKQLEALPREKRAPEDPSRCLRDLPYDGFNEDAFYRSVLGANAESVVGYVPLPVGVVGPLRLDGRELTVPLATTEGALVASTNRGCRAITESGGAVSVVSNDGMTRAPVVRMKTLQQAADLKAWVQDAENLAALKAAFNSTTRFGSLLDVATTLAGRNVYVRFRCMTGDAMGMNMITKGVNEAMGVLLEAFPDMLVLGLSGNVCTDKKSAAINWINGRGKSVVAEARIKGDVLARVLKTDAARMVELNIAKNLVGSAMAGSIGGFNAHAANLVSALYLATGQDVAQNVESSSCLTSMEREGDDLIISCSMPSIEVGTIGGGTTLPAQAANLRLLGAAGANAERPGGNAEALARIVCGTVLAGELSLMSALTSGDLVSGHMKLNRKPSKPEAAAAATATAGTTSAASAAAAASSPRAYSSSPAAHVEAAVSKVPSSAMSPGRHFFAATSEAPTEERQRTNAAASATQEPLLCVP